MKQRTVLAAALMLSALLAACGDSGAHKRTPGRGQATAALTAAGPVTAAAAPATTHPVRPAAPAPDRAFVTAETENRLLVVELPSGRVLRRIALPHDPEDVAAAGNVALVTSGAAGQTTLLEGSPLRPVKMFGGFATPHIVEIAPGGRYAYVTDDTRGTVTVIDLTARRVTSTIDVGTGAHHLCFDVQHQLAYVALGESARTLVLLSTRDLAHPRVIGHFASAFPVHDLACSPNSGRVWLTSASGPDVTLVDGFDQGVVFRVPVGPPPQHVALQGRYAYLTSGYGGVIEQVDAGTGRILARAASPYGSFELAADGRYVVTSSLLRGTLAIYTPGLKLLRVVHLAPATREVALSSPAGSPP